MYKLEEKNINVHFRNLGTLPFLSEVLKLKLFLKYIYTHAYFFNKGKEPHHLLKLFGLLKPNSKDIFHE